MTVALQTVDLGKCYGNQWALRDCALSIPSGKVAACVANDPSLGACGIKIQNFQSEVAPATAMLQWLEFLPLAFGVLLAAPFVLELEQGTYRFAWTQSISRRRWLTVRLSLTVSALVLVALALSVAMT